MLLTVVVLLQAKKSVNYTKCPYCGYCASSKFHVFTHISTSHEDLLDREQAKNRTPFHAAAVRYENINKKGVRVVCHHRINRHTQDLRAALRGHPEEPMLNELIDDLLPVVISECNTVFKREETQVHFRESELSKPIREYLPVKKPFVFHN